MAAPDEEFMKRLRAAFKIEAEEHLQTMSTGLLELEKLPPAARQKQIVETIFREAHSLKGDARSINLTGIETVCQALEDVFALWKKQEIAPSPSQFDSLHHAIDTIGKLMTAPSGSQTTREKRQLAELVAQIARIKTGPSSDEPPGGDPERAEPASGLPETVSHLSEVKAAAGQAEGGQAEPGAAAESKTEAAPAPGERASGQPVPPSAQSSAQYGAGPQQNGAGPENGAPPHGYVVAAHGAAPAEEPAPEPPPRLAEPAWGGTARDAATGNDGSGREEGAENGAAPEKPALQETVRISTAKLDQVLLQAEELLTVKLRAIHHAADLREVEATLDQWKKRNGKVSREARGLRRALRRQEERSDQARNMARMLEFVDWSQGYVKELEGRLSTLAKSAERDHRALGSMVDSLLEDTKKLLMLPFSTLLQAFPRMVRDISRDQGKQVELVIQGAEVEIDKRILQELKDPLIHILRNCIDHGIEKPPERALHHKPPGARVAITIAQVSGQVEILIEDDGAGIDAAKVKEAAVRHGIMSAEETRQLNDQEAIGLIFQSEVSTSPLITELSGRGLGLAIVREKVENLGGRVAVATDPPRGTSFRLTLPLTLATFKGILVEAAGQVFVLPTANVEKVDRVKPEDIHTVENKDTIMVTGHPVALARLDEVLELPRPEGKEAAEFIPVVVLGSEDKRIGFSVDEVLNEQEVLVKSLGKPLCRVRNVAGATVLGSGKAVPILNVSDLMKSATRAGGSRARSGERATADGAAAEAGAKRVLVAEDSITSRMLLKNILETAGYQVKTAVDGVEALTALRTQEFDVVVSDVEMPRMSGFELTAKIRGDKKLAELPVILVTGLASQEHRERGIDVGANAYIVKSSFEQSNLLEVIRRLL